MRGLETLAHQQSDPAVTTEACNITKKFHKAFTLFGKCHTLMNKTIVANSEVQELGTL